MARLLPDCRQFGSGFESPKKQTQDLLWIVGTIHRLSSRFSTCHACMRVCVYMHTHEYTHVICVWVRMCVHTHVCTPDTCVAPDFGKQNNIPTHVTMCCTYLYKSSTPENIPENLADAYARYLCCSVLRLFARKYHARMYSRKYHVMC